MQLIAMWEKESLVLRGHGNPERKLGRDGGGWGGGGALFRDN